MKAIDWDGQALHLLDQRRLPQHSEWLRLDTCQATAQAITDMVVRGAPAIAITAAYGLVLAQRQGMDRNQASALLLASRPTAVNLRWALERLAPVPDAGLEAAAVAIHQADRSINRALGDHGGPLLHGGVLHICNTGDLATGGWGTALGMIRSAHALGRGVHVYILETRPYLQGARLTAHELLADGIPCTLVTDGMAGALMAAGKVRACVAGCDRVAANGDVANKIGTYQLAVLARHHGLPFYVAMPTSTLDRRCPSGAQIAIEERAPDEVRTVMGVQIAPAAVPVWNPAFDCTPFDLITAWISERGIWHPPFPPAMD